MSEKKPSFVSYRPGSQENDLLLRADPKDISVTAKGLLSRTFDMLREERARLCKEFSPAEMQVLFFALHDEPIDSGNLAVRLVDLFATDRTVDEVRHRCQVDAKALASKLQDLTPGARFALEDALSQYRRLPLLEKLGLNGLPPIGVLQRLGCVATDEQGAWGLCVVRFGKYLVELTLRQTPEAVRVGKTSNSLDDLGSALVRKCREAMDAGFDNERDVESYRLAYHIAEKSGFRRFRVEESKDGSAKVVDIPPEVLIRDFEHDPKSAMVLAGVNAPEWPMRGPKSQELAREQTPAADAEGVKPSHRRRASAKRSK